MKYIYCIYKRPDLVDLCLIYNCAFWRPQRKPVSSLGGDVIIQPLAIQVFGWMARLGEIAERVSSGSLFHHLHHTGSSPLH